MADTTIRTPGTGDSARVETSLEKRSANLYSGMVAFHAMAEPGWTTGTYHGLSREGYMRNPVVYRCVRLIAEAAADIPFVIFDGDTEMYEHPALAMLRNPNAHQTAQVFFETVYGHLLLAGDAYIERTDATGGTRFLQVLRPDRVSIETGDDGWPAAWLYDCGRGKRRISAEDGTGHARVLHLSQFHPLDDVNGFAPVQAAAMAIDTHNSAARWNKALLDNAARPSGALVYAPGDDSHMPPDQFERIKQQLEEGYTGAMNAGRPLLLEGGLDWKAMGLTPRDMDFIEAKNSASRDIALAFGVPPMMLGIPGDNTYSNYQEANRGFYRLTVLPLVKRITQALTSWLSPLYEGSVRVDVDLDQVPGLTAERDALWARLEGASFLTENEKREAVGYTPQVR